MAKCTICNSRKGKRNCKISSTNICSLCCGTSRTKENCMGCSYYKAPNLRKRYSQVPSYSTQTIADSPNLESYANSIESSLCAFDDSCDQQMNDDNALRIIELLLDHYHFKDSPESNDSERILQGFNYVGETIRHDLNDISEDKITKTLGTLHFVGRRRSNGNREYLDFIQNYVGHRVAPGVRLMRNPI